MNWNSWFQRRRWEHQMNAEFQFHLENQIEEYIHQGLSRREAEVRARREFGPLELAKDESRDQRPWEPLDHWVRDLRYAARSLRKSPGFTAAAVLTLALGIGANTAIFSVLDGAVLSPLPYRDPDRLVVLALYNRALKHPTSLAYPDFLDWQRGARSFEELAAFLTAPAGLALTAPGTPEHVSATQVSSGFFHTLGVKLALGREFSAKEDKVGARPVAVISDRLWQDRFGGRANAMGESLTLSGTGYVVVGVLQPGFRFGNLQPEIYTPIGQGDPLQRQDRTIHNIVCVARLAPGVTPDQAHTEMNTIQQRIDQLNPATERGQETYLDPLKRFIVGDVGGTLRLLFGAVGLVLLIACANLANLLLARSAARAREFAVRLALGGGRWQIVRQLLTETLLASLAGGVLGLALAKWGVRAALAAAPGSVPRPENIGLSAPVLAFALAVSIAAGAAFGLWPALKSSGAVLPAALKQAGRGLIGGAHRTQRALVVVQIALALILLSGGSLLFRSIRNLWSVNPGFNAQHLVTFQVSLTPSTGQAGTREAYRQLMEGIRRIPGVQAADMTALVPLTQHDNSGPFFVGSHEGISSAEGPRAVYYWTGPDYARVMQIPLLHGRFLSPRDTRQSAPVAVIDSLLAQRYFPGRDAVGQTMTIPHWGVARIIGVVGHVRHLRLAGSNPLDEEPQIYCSIYQLLDAWVPAFFETVTITARTSLDTAALLPVLQDAVRGAGGRQPVYNLRTMQDWISDSIAPQRFAMILLVTFAGLALLLACIGIYGVIAYWMTRRVQEFGVRLALGARPRDVLRIIVRQGMSLALAGAAIGTVAALILMRTVSSFSQLLYGVSSSDPLALIVNSLALLTAALLACYFPARRAARMDPSTALRQD